MLLMNLVVGKNKDADVENGLEDTGRGVVSRGKVRE